VKKIISVQLRITTFKLRDTYNVILECTRVIMHFFDRDKTKRTLLVNIWRCTLQNYVVEWITFLSVDADGVVVYGTSIIHLEHPFIVPRVRILAGRTFLDFNLNSCLVQHHFFSLWCNVDLLIGKLLFLSIISFFSCYQAFKLHESIYVILLLKFSEKRKK